MTNKRNRTPRNDDNTFEITKANGAVSKEIGVPGLSINMGKVKEDTLAILRGPKKLKLLEEMVRYDPTVGAFNNILQSQVLSVEWSSKAKDESNEAKSTNDLINSILFEDLSSGTFDELVLNAMTKTCYGFSVIEPVFKKRDGYKKDRSKSSIFTDGKIGISKFASRYQGSISEFEFDDKFRNITAIKQKDPNMFNETLLSYEKVLHFKHNSTNGNPQGQSLYLNCVVPYDRKKKTSQSEDQRYDKGFAGIYEITLPGAVLDPNTTNAGFKACQDWSKTTGANVSMGRTQSVIKPEYVSTEIKSSNNDGIDGNMIIERCNREIAVALLSDFFLITQKSGNSGALGQAKIKVFKTMINSMLDEIANELNTKLIPMLMEKNALDMAFAPTINHTEIDDLDLTNMMLFVQSAEKSGLLVPTLDMANFTATKVMGKDAPQATQEQFEKHMVNKEILRNDSLDKQNAQPISEVKEEIV